MKAGSSQRQIREIMWMNIGMWHVELEINILYWPHLIQSANFNLLPYAFRRCWRCVCGRALGEELARGLDYLWAPFRYLADVHCSTSPAAALAPATPAATLICSPRLGCHFWSILTGRPRRVAIECNLAVPRCSSEFVLFRTGLSPTQLLRCHATV